jgi:hypothetical protein
MVSNWDPMLPTAMLPNGIDVGDGVSWPWAIAKFTPVLELPLIVIVWLAGLNVTPLLPGVIV